MSAISMAGFLAAFAAPFTKFLRKFRNLSASTVLSKRFIVLFSLQKLQFSMIFQNFLPVSSMRDLVGIFFNAFL